MGMSKRDEARLRMITSSSPPKQPQTRRPGTPKDPMQMLQATVLRIEQRQIQQNALLMQLLERFPASDEVDESDEANDPETEDGPNTTDEPSDEPRSA